MWSEVEYWTVLNMDRKNVPDIKAGDTDNDKTVKASNTWEENVMYAERDGHYEEMKYLLWPPGAL